MARRPLWTSTRDSWETRAMVILINEARALPAFAAGLAAVDRAIRAAHAEYMRIRAEGGDPIAYMRGRGGWPKIADDAFKAEVAGAASEGSRLIGPIKLAGQMLDSDWRPFLDRAITEWQETPR